MHATDLWCSTAGGPRALRVLLTPVSWLYGAGWQSYLALYRLGVKRAKEPHRPVFCIGNLTVGGSGKSPLTIHLFDLLSELGAPPVVSGSGYGSPAAQGANLVPEGPLDARQWGDEAAMFRWLRPEMPLIVGRNRVLAAQIAHENYPDRPLLLDDGFQHLPLKKHFSIVLDDPNPANRLCLPAGPYREPRSNRSRAELILPGEFTVEPKSGEFIEPRTGEQVQAGQVQVLCALGRPDRFLDSLRANGHHIATAKTLPDHDSLQGGTLWEGFDPNLPIVATAKDWVKLRERTDIEHWQILVARHEVTVEPAHAFRQLIHATLEKNR